MNNKGFNKKIKTSLIALSLGLASLASPVSDASPISSPSSTASSPFNSDFNVDVSKYINPRFNKRQLSQKCKRSDGSSESGLVAGTSSAPLQASNAAPPDILSQYLVKYSQSCLDSGQSQSQLQDFTRNYLSKNKAKFSLGQSVQVDCAAPSSPVSTKTTSGAQQPPANQPDPSSANGDSQNMVNLHNKLRSSLGKGNLVWDDSLASTALNAAQRQPGCNQLKHTQSGENLFAWAGTNMGYTQAFDGWVSPEEVSQASVADTYNHYTQVIWGATTKVGCAKVFDSSSSCGWIACHYQTAGNVVGQSP